MTRLIDLLFTPTCIGCGQLGDHLCRNCELNLDLISYRTFAGYESISTAGDYGGWLRESLIQYKSGQKQISGGLAKVLATTLTASEIPGPIKLVPIPTSQEKLSQRGYDHMHEILKLLNLDSDRYQIRYGQLQVRSGIADQVGLSAAARKRNLSGAFKSKSQITGNVCVIDDVITTGATLSAASKALKLAGAQRVFGVAICGTNQWR